MSSSSVSCFFLPQILHATTARAPMRMAPPIPTTTPIMVFFCDDEMPELPEPPLPPFRPGELVEVDLLDVDALLVMTREMVLLPLTVTIVVVTRATVSLSLGGAAVVVINEVWLCGGVEDSAVIVGVLLDGVGEGILDVCCAVVGAEVGDTGAADEDEARELVATEDDSDCDADADADSDATEELADAADEEPPVPTGVL
jgi:hypothetical protein